MKLTTIRIKIENGLLTVDEESLPEGMVVVNEGQESHELICDYYSNMSELQSMKFDKFQSNVDNQNDGDETYELGESLGYTADEIDLFIHEGKVLSFPK